MNYSELDEVADSLGDLTRAVTYDEALTLARRAMPEEGHTIISNLASAIMTRSLRFARHG